MRKQHSKKKRRTAPKTILRLPDLDQAKSAVLNSLMSTDAQRGYRHAIDEFVEWYCSEPRLSFNRTVVLRYRIHLEERKLAPGTVNLRLGAVRRLAYEASDCGLLSADLAAGIRRVKGVKKIGVRLGNWLLPDQAVALLEAPDSETMKGKRDVALLAILVACGLRRHEAVELKHLAPAATGGPLGDRRPDRQGLTHSDHSGAGLGKGSGRQLAAVGRDLEREDLQARDPSRHGVGERFD